MWAPGLDRRWSPPTGRHRPDPRGRNWQRGSGSTILPWAQVRRPNGARFWHFRKANLTVICMAGVLVSCTTPRISAPPELQPTDARGTIAVLHASGVQIYQCKRANDGRLLWSFSAPEATLKDDTGQLVVVNTTLGRPGSA
ncbi:DUF3455 domain-containing protein [Cupriavidus basilensis]